jgi:tagaturonate reductase
MSLGFAAYIAFMKCMQEEDGKYYGTANGTTYLIDDNAASFFAEQWAKNDIDELVNCVLANESLWGADLSVYREFARTIKENLLLILNEGVAAAIEKRHLQKITV